MPSFLIPLPTNIPQPSPTDLPTPSFPLQLECLESVYTPSLTVLSASTSSHPDRIRLRFESFPIELNLIFDPPVIGGGLWVTTEVRLDAEGGMVDKLGWWELEERLNGLMGAYFGSFTDLESLKDDESVVDEDEDEGSEQVQILYSIIDEVRSFASEIRNDPTEEDYLLYEEIDSSPLDQTDEEISTNPSRRVLDHCLISRFLGTTTPSSIESLLRKAQKDLRLLHYEVIVRSNLLKRFEQKREQMIARAVRAAGGGRRGKDEIANKVGRWEIVYHGTPRRNVLGIVRTGFQIPGSKAVPVRCGSTWGQGIYSSPDPTYCLPYGIRETGGLSEKGKRLLPGQKIIVCAVLMGNKLNMKHGNYLRGIQGVTPGYDSHVSPSGLEYVVFSPSQILPLLVLHLGTETDCPPVAFGGSRVTGGLRKPEEEWVTKEDLEQDKGLKEKRNRMTEYARRHFPEGFGPAGSKFVVEEVGEVDDDEEQWGEFQNEDEFQGERFWNDTIGRLKKNQMEGEKKLD